MSILVKDKELGVCIETHCKAKQERLYFCHEHYEHFKFGVIRKNGTHPSDHEKKGDQYRRHCTQKPDLGNIRKTS